MPVAYLKRVLTINLIFVLAFILLASASTAYAQTRTISFRNMHTKEELTVQYMRNGRHIPDAMQKINQILRDWRRNESIRMNPDLIDLIYEVHEATGSTEPINVVSGYRSPVTNAALRGRSNGVARNSQHILGNATDLFFPDVSVAKIREVALRFQGGGVGYYPTSGQPFVHIDVGRVRHWPRMSPQQLARIFPDGNTLHIPSNGRPLPRTAPSTEILTASLDASAPARSTDQQVVTPTPASDPIIVASLPTSGREFDTARTLGSDNDVTALAQNTGTFRIGSVFGRDASATSLEGPPSEPPVVSGEPPIAINIAGMQMPVSRPDTLDAGTGTTAEFQLAGLTVPASRPEYSANAVGDVRTAEQSDPVGQIILASLSEDDHVGGASGNGFSGAQYYGARLDYRQPVVNDLVTTDRAEGMSFASFTAPNPENLRDLTTVGAGAIALSFTDGRLGNAAANRVFEGPAVRALQVAFAS
jgi:uncharacterized protein YcbK (DUF882 family)